MPIYRISSSDDSYPLITKNPDALAQMNKYSKTRGIGIVYVQTVHDDPTEDELKVVEGLNSWLIENYENGAHWVYETTEKVEHVLKIREHGIDEYKKQLESKWKTIHDYATDIQGA